MSRLQTFAMHERVLALISTITTSSTSTKALYTAVIGLAVIGAWKTTARLNASASTKHDEQNEPGLFKKHSSFESFTTPSGFNYPRIRVFHHPHPEAAKLPKDFPLLVFMHGLGGTATQFSSLLTSLVNVASCLAIDLPGCGLSDFKPDDPQAYTTAAFAELLAMAIDRHRDKENNQKVVLVGHSMGCSIAALLASSTSPLQARLGVDYVLGFLAICPRANAPDERETRAINRLHYVPTLLFDAMRFFDRRGGLESRSITRVVGAGADVETRKLQQKYNKQSKSAVVMRFATAAVSAPVTQTQKDAVPWPGKEVWSGVKVPLFLAAGEADKLTPPEEVDQIARWLTDKPEMETDGHGVSKADLDATTEQNGNMWKSPEIVPTTTGDVKGPQDHQADPLPPRPRDSAHAIPATTTVRDHHQATAHGIALKMTILPAPASHALMYATSTTRILSGLIADFLSTHIDPRLSPGWQLQHLTTSGKWDVKNLQKWTKIDACSEPIAGVFRAMKTMREVDEQHNPTEFVKKFGRDAKPDGVAVVVDISHERPVYDPDGLEKGGVKYHKFPTVSKLPPAADEVAEFIRLVDDLRQSSVITDHVKDGAKPTIGVHCHYGTPHHLHSREGSTDMLVQVSTAQPSSSLAT